MVQEGMLYTLGKRGPLLENGRDPYDVYAGSHQILAVCRSLALGCTCRCLAQNRAVKPYTLVLGSYMQVPYFSPTLTHVMSSTFRIW